MRKRLPSCDDVYENSNVDIISRGLDLLDLRTDSPALNLTGQPKRQCGHTFSERHQSDTCVNSSSYASSSSSSLLLKPKEVAKLFNPERKARRHSNNSKTNKQFSRLNDASDQSIMKTLKTSSNKQVGDYLNDSKWCQRTVKSPGSKSRDVSNIDGDLTDISSSSKLSNNFFLNQKRCLSRKSTKFSKSRKRSTMSVLKEGKFEFHCGDYFRSPSSHKVSSGIKALSDGKLEHFPTAIPINQSRPSVEDLKEKSSPTLESMGIGKGDLDIKGVCAPQKKSIHDALYQRVAYFVNPDISVIIDSHEFLCHKIVLQCYSEYFEELKNHTEVVVEGVTKGAFIAIYNWMLAPDYEGLRFIQKNNILEVLIASKILVIKELENQCLAFIDSKEAFSEENAYLLFIDASKSFQTEIMELMVPRIQMFFLVLASSHEFTALEVDDLCTILQSNYIIVHCELEVFMSAVKWLMANWEERLKYLGTVMKCIRFGLMTPAQLVDIRKNPNSPEFIEITNDKTVQMMIEDGLAYSVESGLSGKTDHHTQRCELLKLKIPEPRNWAKKKKDFRSYREFLNYLNEISKDPQSFYSEMKKIGAKAETNSTANGTCNTSSSSDESYGSKILRASQNVMNASSKKPSLSDLLCKEKSKQNTKMSITRGAELSESKHRKSKVYDDKLSTESWAQTDKPIIPKNRDILNKALTKDKRALMPSPTKRMSLREKAATVIQATYRGYAVRKRICNSMNLDIKEPKSSRRLTFDSMFLQVKTNSDQDVTTDDDLPLMLKKGRRKLKSKTTLKRSSSTDSNESIISVKEGPAIRRMSHPYHRTKSIILIGGVNPMSKHPSGHEASQIYRQNNFRSRSEYILSLVPRVGIDSDEEEDDPGEMNDEEMSHQIDELFEVIHNWDTPVFADGEQQDEVSLTPPPEVSPGVAAPNQGSSTDRPSQAQITHKKKTPKRKLKPVDYKFSLESNSWDKIDRMPLPRYYHGSALLKGKIYIVGGCNPENEDNNIPSLFTENYSYEPVSGSWSKEPELKTPRRSFGLVTFFNHLYAIGGQDGNDTILSSVERFDPTRRMWEDVSPLPEPSIGAAICIYKNLIWVAGGMNGSTSNVNVSKEVWCYDPRLDLWTKKPCLRFGRAFASLATYEDYLFLVGGVTSENGGIVSNDHIDVWDGENGVWKLKGNIDLPRHGHSVAFIGSLMVLMGGVTTKNVKGLNQVDSLCMITGSRSKQIASLPSPLVGHSCVLLPPMDE